MTEKRVLIVDDDDDIRANIKDILDELGFQTDTAQDGAEALRLAGHHQYDVALLDYQMPGMDGATLHSELLKIQPNIVSIMVTAFAGADGAKRTVDLGVRRILRKPVNLDELLPMVAEA
ncbi:response regulator [Aureliella helgolandensis]|uniref:Sporulation initiation phosphotransferase F n=1 Tax=Aureliella helgolandensis TaxID=2527968 RepID=A0A518GD24_9BACT|nr:response regulator [Aureliella helgolandensis]QDV26468.1 Sporulation initiation phosphotransferase F [Aureliella helgolandensis]